MRPPVQAYECYLRGNQLVFDSRQWAPARDLYLRSVTLDPQFAPAWARLGRSYRLLSKYGDPDEALTNAALAEEALKRVLTLSPDLALAHHLYTYVEVEMGRPREAMVRLLERSRRHPSEPELFAGLGQAGRGPEGVELLQAAIAGGIHRTMQDEVTGVMAAMQGRSEELIAAVGRMLTRAGYKDPEGFYHWAGAHAQAGAHDSALAMLERSIQSGFYAGPGLARKPWLDPLRSLPDFIHIVRSADELQREALDAFRAADGPRVLGVPQL